jgi:hypothetical protein
MRQPKAFRDHHSAKIHFLANKDVRPPLLAQREDRGGALARNAAGVASADGLSLPLSVKREQRAVRLVVTSKLAPPVSNASKPDASTVATIPVCPAKATT